MPDLRCDNKLFGVVSGHVIEVKCNSKFCGAGPGVVVLHRFDLQSSQVIETLTFKEPRKEEQ